MTNQEKRIKLALAMGWTHVPAVGPRAFIRYKVKDGEDIGLMNNIQPFNPFINANDDYTVLEWMRKKFGVIDSQEWQVFINELAPPWKYKIGDNARAALKVIE